MRPSSCASASGPRQITPCEHALTARLGAPPRGRCCRLAAARRAPAAPFRNGLPAPRRVRGWPRFHPGELRRVRHPTKITLSGSSGQSATRLSPELRPSLLRLMTESLRETSTKPATAQGRDARDAVSDSDDAAKYDPVARVRSRDAGRLCPRDRAYTRFSESS